MYHRMFSHNNRLDYQLFFDTRRALKPLGWNGLTVAVAFTSVLVFLVNYNDRKSGRIDRAPRVPLPEVALVALAVGRFLSPGVARLLGYNLQLRRAISLWSPLVPILFMGLYIYYGKYLGSKAILVPFLLLLVVVLLLTISRLQFPSIIKLVHRALGSKQVLWYRVLINSCTLATGVMLLFMTAHLYNYVRVFAVIVELYAIAVLSLGNLQIPAAIARVVLALIRLLPHDYYGDNITKIDTSIDKNWSKINLAPSLNIFYGMVLGQGVLYSMACIFEIFSFIPRRSLARRGGFGGQWGMESVNLYYAYAFEKYLHGDVLAPKNISINNFAIDSLNSDTPKMQFTGIRIMYSLLQKHATRRRMFLEVNASTETMARLINMLDWTSPEHTTVRLFAAKVTAELATRLRVVTIPGTVQVVSALLDYSNYRQRKENPLLDTNFVRENLHDSILNVDENQDERLDAAPNTDSLLETQDRRTQHVVTTKLKSWISKCFQWISKFWSIPQDEPLTEQDLLPALGMLILDGLAGCDQGNCVEISRECGLIPKIIGFTSCSRRVAKYTEAQRKVLVKSSLKLLHRLTSVEGESGIILRHNVSKNSFLLRNLAEILGDGRSSQELRTSVVEILRNLAIDEKAREAIGRNQVIVTWLKQAFLKQDRPSSSDADRLLREVVGQALAMLAMDNVNNCLAILLGERGNEFVEVLTSMIHIERYRCVSASLLRNICQHARPELKEADLKELSYCLRQVLEIILVADGPELDIFIGLSSEISKIVPGDFNRELDDDHIKDKFVKKLVEALNANAEPSAQCPGIRRVVLEQAITMMEHDSRYTNCFIDRRMEDALSMVEETASEAENYGLFLDYVGLMEAREPLSSLVARAKQQLAAYRSSH
ncbi:hypothetical protein HU200_052165 [Digitaria exilis]|uniref:Uncharacterized protein n=1 Tax=Digitaria exilis TaxID=1010633 RepID=A0A835AUI8_9POAL|nr:hypothetical protein HU200_052165 [Digitaria exilis]